MESEAHIVPQISYKAVKIANHKYVQLLKYHSHWSKSEKTRRMNSNCKTYLGHKKVFLRDRKRSIVKKPVCVDHPLSYLGEGCPCPVWRISPSPIQTVWAPPPHPDRTRDRTSDSRTRDTPPVRTVDRMLERSMGRTRKYPVPVNRQTAVKKYYLLYPSDAGGKNTAAYVHTKSYGKFLNVCCWQINVLLGFFLKILNTVTKYCHKIQLTKKGNVVGA